MIRSKKINPENVDFKISKYRDINVIETNTQIQTKICLYRPTGCHIERIDRDHYRIKRTGTVKEIHHGTKRTDNISSIAQSMKRLRDIINTNVSSDNVDNIRWVTLTYKENMTDTVRLYEDFKKFMQRLRYWCNKNNYSRPEYIGVIEPQARGSWHWHILLIFPTVAPFIANHALSDIWGFGFVSIKALDKNCHNIGIYLSAYLSDLNLEDAITAKTDFSKHHVKQANGKSYIKGSRLALYPKGCKLYRLSKGIKRPKEYTMQYNEFLNMIDKKDAALSYENLIWIYDDSSLQGFSTLVQNRYYDITPPAQQRMKLYKSYLTSKYYRTLFAEMHILMYQCSEFQEYKELYCINDYFILQN